MEEFAMMINEMIMRYYYTIVCFLMHNDIPVKYAGLASIIGVIIVLLVIAAIMEIICGFFGLLVKGVHRMIVG